MEGIDEDMHTVQINQMEGIDEDMEVQCSFRISTRHLRNVVLYLSIIGYFYRSIAMPSQRACASSNYTTDRSVSASASACICIMGYSTPIEWTLSDNNSNYNDDIIFINHHPPDVGKTFASQLSSSLNSSGMRIGTIETAAVYVAIFSRNYAKSSHCLKELLHMVESGVSIIPIFYDVKPSDLRCQVKKRALYCEDLRMLEEKTLDRRTHQEGPRYDFHEIKEWRKALLNASGIVGFERAAYNGDEGMLVRNVVKYVVTSMVSIEELEKPNRYHVFISHRGPDTKNTLASHLYHRLNDCGLRVIFDKEELRKGHRVTSEIEHAIKVAYVHIAIFSTGYADSEWCNDELVRMLESEAVIIPVFIVKPTDMWNRVDGMNGVYAEALQILKEKKTVDPETRQEKLRYDSDTIETWRKVLMEVTSRDGFELETYDGYEGQLVDNVVREVVRVIEAKERTILAASTTDPVFGLCEEQELDDLIHTELINELYFR